MKKSFISKLMILSVATLIPLASCGEPTNSSSEVLVRSIDILPIETAVVGEEINLDDYVTVDGDTTDYTVNIATPDLVTCEGHVITIVDEGDISIEIVAGSETGYIEFKSISATLAKFKAFNDKVDKEFFKAEVSSSTGRLTGDGSFYTEKYNITYTSGSTTSSASYSGYIFTNDNEIYSATMDDVSGKNFTVLPGQLSSMYYEPSSFNVPYEYLTTEVEGTDTYLHGGEQAADAYCDGIGYMTMSRFASSYLGIQAHGELEVQMNSIDTGTEKYDFAFVILYVIADEAFVDSGKTYPAGTNLGFVDMGAFFGDAEFYTLQPAEDYVDQNKKPDPVDTSKLTNAITTIADGKNYTVDFSAYWSDSNDVKVAAPDLSDYWFAQSVIETSFKQYVTSDSVYTVLTEEDSNTFDYYYTEGSTLKHRTNINGSDETEDVKTATSIWDTSFNGVSLLNGLASATSAIESMNVVSSKTNGNLFNFVLTGVAGGTDYIAEVLGLNPFYNFKGFYSNEPFPAYTGVTVVEGLLMSMTIENDIDNNITFDLSFNWTSDQIYHMKTTISNAGKTVIPELN